MRTAWSPARWAAQQRPTTLLAVRLLIVANVTLLSAIGALYLIFASGPGGIIIAAISSAAVVFLVALIPYTNPHRHEHSRW